jgi:VWFA-related protein
MRAFCAAIALLLIRPAGPPLPAESPAQFADDSAPQPLRTAQKIQLTIYAEDAQGRPLQNLRRENLQIFDEGREQSILEFRGPRQVLNSAEAFAAPEARTVVLLHFLHRPPRNKKKAFERLLQFLQSVPASQATGVYAYAEEFRVLLEMGKPTATLAAQLEQRHGPAYDHLLAWFAEITEEGRMGRPLRRPPFTPIEQLAHHVARFPGPKHLVWISDTAPRQTDFSRLPVMTGSNPLTQLRVSEIFRFDRAMQFAGFVVHMVDAAELLGAEWPMSRDPSAAPVIAGANLVPPSRADGNSVLAAMASRTGGRAFLKKEIADVWGALTTDCAGSYGVSYSPAEVKWDGAYRHIEVRTDVPGARLRYRTGYYALPREPMDLPYRNGRLRDYLSSPVPLHDLQLQLESPAAHFIAGQTVTLQLQFPSADLFFDHGPEGLEGQFDMLIAQRDSAGRYIRNGFEQAAFRIAPENADVAAQRMLRVEKKVAIAPEAREILIIARDPKSGAVGSARIAMQSSAPAP